MTPAARTQAAIELLDRITAAARDGGAAADVLVRRYFAERRYAGSGDRRAVRELVYAAVRELGGRPEGGRAALVALAGRDERLRATFDGSPRGPAPIREGESAASFGVAPAWLLERLGAAGLDGAALAALVGRAPLDLRVNALLTARDEVAAELGGAAAMPGLPHALRLAAGTDVAALAGRAEVQDAGSQAVTLATRVRPGDRVVDLCAGSGGKTLAMAAMMADRGAILACDADRARLSRLPPRAARAGVTLAEALLLDPGRERERLADWRDAADVVLVDAPCSGTGTWRRNPEAKWRLTPDRLARLGAAQARLMDIGAELVRPGGALTYVVCSLLDEEGRRQAERFLGSRAGWTAESPALPLGGPHGLGWRLTPGADGTDGFFVARLIRPC